MSCLVKVSQGEIRGAQKIAFDGTKYYSFEGIPFAKPPVGELRFRDPQPPVSWTCVKDCTKPGNKCAQINPYSNKGFEGSEDCLYLNVYTPSLPTEKLEKLPVIFFIHGGRLLVGYGDYYQPDYFMKHNVILVTTNYRLNILGFLCLDIPEVPGNAGMKDCVMALRWVKSNVSNFNGDSNNVTVMGESAGASIATSFLISNMTVGLFEKVINQSGNCLSESFLMEKDNVKVAGGIANMMGQDLKDTYSLYRFLQTVDLEDLVIAYVTAESSKPHYSLGPVLPAVYEKEFEGVESFIRMSPLQLLRHGYCMQVPILAGCHMYEGAAFVQTDNDDVIYESDFKYFVPKYMQLSEGSPKFLKTVNALRNFYFNGRDVGDETKDNFMRLVSDAYFQKDIVEYAELVSKCNKQLYCYNFRFVGNLNIGVMRRLGVRGTTHGDMVQYQFYRESKSKKMQKEDASMIEFLSECWSNFAKTGKPSWSNQEIEWVPYTPAQKMTLVIDNQKTLERNRDYDNYKFWVELCGYRAKI